MASTQDKPSQAPNAPLNVKEQLEATATRFWTSVTKGNEGGEGTDGVKVPGVPVGLFAKKSPSNDGDEQKETKQNSFQFIVNTMFSSCTTGGNNFDTLSQDGSVPSLLKQANRSKTVATTALTPSPSGAGDSSSPEKVTPSPLHQQKTGSAVKTAIQETSKTLFKNNHDVAQEAIFRLREQHRLGKSEKLVTDSLYESEMAVDTERASLISTRSSMFSPSTLSMNPSTLSNNRTLSTFQDSERQASRKASLQKLISNRAKKNAKIPAKRQELSFFPASKPKDTRKDKRMKEKLKRNKGVPKEVTPTSPMRMLRSRNNERQKHLLNKTADSEEQLFSDDFNAQCEANENVDDSWDIENDGISDITQSTVDRMVRAISQHLRVFPEEAETLNRIHSDMTDPAPKKGASSDHFLSGGGVAGFGRIVTPPRGQKSTKMAPDILNRTFGSVGTKSFFTKTTQSTQTNDFANVWKIDEQRFWDSEVAKESKQDLVKPKSPGKLTVVKKSKRLDSSTITTATTPTTLFTSPHSPSFFNNPADQSQEMMFTDHDKLMDNLVKQTELEMAEI
eukprot:CAMPEP_0116127060 /NCGR_PEP_ID=MMETSP0329-20121206/6647_1 /TAXON_ID=697910 /ORGANISM="Pseudo-nitzschia arenysensis, Strain B593" /LENGTH=562 /DNA_ID=CAMNT_0003621151 /DNA_START=509 /DNA_END=2197 /DNA_ORIENTATION=+